VAALKQRLTGIDAARGLALLGMMSTHTMPLFDPGPGNPPSLVGLLYSGRSAALFAVLAGVGLALLSGRESPHGGPALAADRRAVAARAVVILAIGLSLGGLDVNVAVILVHYAVLFLCMLPFLGLPLRALSLWVTGWVLLSPVLAYLVRPQLAALLGAPRLSGNPDWDSVMSWESGWNALGDVLFTGYYPVVQWMTYLLFGLILGRLALSRLKVQLILIVAGGLVAFAAKGVASFFLDYLGGQQALLATDEAARWPLESLLQVDLAWVDQRGSWWWLATAAPHAGTTLDLLHTTGVAAAVLGVCLLVTRASPRVLLPLSGAGAMTLTLYSLHVWALSLTVHGLPPGWTPDLLFLAHAIGALLLGTVFALAGWRGPLELVAHAAAALAAHRRGAAITTPGRRRLR
jgi:uncharacterized membrane protein YeiB